MTRSEGWSLRSGANFPVGETAEDHPRTPDNDWTFVGHDVVEFAVHVRLALSEIEGGEDTGKMRCEYKYDPFVDKRVVWFQWRMVNTGVDCTGHSDTEYTGERC